MKKLIITAILGALLLSIGAIMPPDNVSAHKVNSCPQLTPLKDATSIKLEKTAGAAIIWDKVNKDLITAKNKYEKAIKDKGWKITYNSAYRPQEYQKHFVQIVNLVNSGKATACVKAEKAYHGLGTSASNTVSNHTKGLAFDATIRNKSGVVLNKNGKIHSDLKAVAKKVGLKFPYESFDAIHHELIKVPSTTKKSTTPTVYSFNAKGKLTKKLLAYKGAKTTSGSYYKYKVGESVKIVGVVGDYYKVVYKNTYTYVKGVKSGVTISSVTQTTKNATGTITSSNGLHLRKYPHELAKNLGLIKKNVKVKILAVSGNWYKVKSGNTTGYIKGVKSGVKVTAAAVKYPKKGYVSGSNVNVRKSASTKGTKITQLKKNTVVTVTAASNNWYKIKYNNGKIGWISADYVVFK